MTVPPTDQYEMIVNRCLGNAFANLELRATNVIYAQTEVKLSRMGAKDVSVDVAKNANVYQS